MNKEFKGYAPKYGGDCSDEYVGGYKKSHLGDITFEYKLGYLQFKIVDSLFDSYTLLDIGCGTAGYYRILNNYKKIVGIDYSKKMLEAADELAVENEVHNCKFQQTIFEKYNTDATFDVIRFGVYSTYEPVKLEVIQKAYDLLKTGEILVISNQSPKGFCQCVNAFLQNGHIYMSAFQFYNLISKVTGFNEIIKLEIDKRKIHFFQKI